jgi:hypothetical protein
VAACREKPISVTERGAAIWTPGWPRRATGSRRRRNSGPAGDGRGEAAWGRGWVGRP